MTEDWLYAQAARSPERIGLIFAGETERVWDYRALNQQANQTVSGLRAAGVRPGQAVAVWLPNCPEYVLLVHAAARLGAILVPLNLRLSAAELAWQVKQADCEFLVGDAQTLAAVTGPLPEKLRLINCAEICAHPYPDRAVDGEGTPPEFAGWDLERVQAIIFTSGTTGQPKGACLTFGNHFWSAMASAYRLGIDPGDRWLAPLPLYHVGGLALVFRSVLYGTTLVLQERTTSQAILETIASGQVTQVSLVPTMLQRLLELPGAAEKLASLRCILLGGAPASAQLLERSLAAGLNLALTYGMTETASQIATAAPAETRRKPGSVGKPLLFSRVRILDDSGKGMPAGQIGAIAVSGPTLMKGYYQQSGISIQAGLTNAEFITGDLGYLDEDGDLWVVQRRVDLIISGGENIYPAEIETVLLAHADILSACVVGLPDLEWGQRVAAAVVRREASRLDEAALIDFCRQRLAGYKIPRQILFVDHLPVTELGKILRRQVADLLAQRPVV